MHNRIRAVCTPDRAQGTSLRSSAASSRSAGNSGRPLAALVALAAVLAAALVVAPRMLAVGATDGELAGTLDQVRQRLADSPSTGVGTAPALEVMVSDFSRYHLAMAVVGALVAIALIGLSIMWWTRFARTESSDRRTRCVVGSFGSLSVLLSLVVLVVVAANAMTAADPAPALLAFFEGGW